MKDIIERAKQIILKPNETWLVIKGETGSIQELFINYVAPLALIPAVATLIGLSIIGIRMPSGHLARAPFLEAMIGGVLGYIFHLIGVYAGGWVVYFLAPYFDSKQDLTSSMKVVVYAMTPVWLVGVFSIFPGLGILQVLGLYGIYLLYLGLITILEVPHEKAVWFTILMVITSLFISIILSIFLAGSVYGPMFMRMMTV